MGIPQSIYVVETLKNKVKIGIASNVKKRFSAIQCQSGNKITNSFFTERCNKAHKIETLLHNTYKDNRDIGEWFTIDFQTVVEYLKTIKLDFSDLEESDRGNRLPDFPIYLAGWAVIMAFTKPCTENTFDRLIESIDDAIDMFYKYSCDDDRVRPKEGAHLKFELMRILNIEGVKRVSKRIGI